MQREIVRASVQKRLGLKSSTGTTFHETRLSHRHYSLKNNEGEYSETLHPNPDLPRYKKAKSKQSQQRKKNYWQNWLLPQGLRLPAKNSPPTLFSYSVCALFSDNNEVILRSHCDEQMQFASLTKIMTALTVVKLCNTYGIKIRQTWVRIQKQASMMEGTSADLRNGEEVLIIDLLYGLMLPSGNDAAVALAQYLGKYLSYFFVNKNFQKADQQKEGICNFEAQKQFYRSQYQKESLQLFVFEMNKNARKMGLLKTKFTTPTGLTDGDNVSTAHQICLLTAYCLKNHLLRSIFRKKNYSCESRNQKMASFRQIIWKNTNRHLFQIRDCIGVKTGITPGAGPCLSSAYRVMGRELIVVILRSFSLDHRYTDAQNIYRFTQLKLQQH